MRIIDTAAWIAPPGDYRGRPLGEPGPSPRRGKARNRMEHRSTPLQLREGGVVLEGSGQPIQMTGYELEHQKGFVRGLVFAAQPMP